MSVQRFYLYAERGLARKRVSIWLYDGRLHIAHREVLLACYVYQYDRKARRLRAGKAPQLYHTAYVSPQLELWELDDAQWRKVIERPLRRRRCAPTAAAQVAQSALPFAGVVI